MENAVDQSDLTAKRIYFTPSTQSTIMLCFLCLFWFDWVHPKVWNLFFRKANRFVFSEFLDLLQVYSVVYRYWGKQLPQRLFVLCAPTEVIIFSVLSVLIYHGIELKQVYRSLNFCFTKFCPCLINTAINIKKFDTFLGSVHTSRIKL